MGAGASAVESLPERVHRDAARKLAGFDENVSWATWERTFDAEADADATVSRQTFLRFRDEYLKTLGALTDEANSDDLWAACKRGDLDRVKSFLGAAAAHSDDATNAVYCAAGKGRTPLYCACYCNQADVAEYLLDNGAYDESAYLATGDPVRALLHEYGIGVKEGGQRPPKGAWREGWERYRTAQAKDAEQRREAREREAQANSEGKEEAAEEAGMSMFAAGGDY